MDSFEDLGLDPGLVEALAAEGIERPTPLQQAAVPVIRRGNNLVAHAGPGAGTLATYGAALLDRLEAGGGRPRGVVLVPTADAAERLAQSLARLGGATGHAVAALGSFWVLPEHADVLFATPQDLLAAVGEDRVDLGEVEALVVDGAASLARTGGLGALETLLEYVPRDGQKVVVSLPMTEEVSDFVDRHVKRAVHVPPQAAVEPEETPRRGEVRFRIVEEPKEEAAVQLAAEVLGGTARHLVLFCRSEDRAADVGDFLALHGFASGSPGEGDVPVWLAVDELEALPALEGTEDLEVASFDAPAGPDSLDRRHGGGRGGTVLLLPRELPHLRDVARRTGYRLAPDPPAAPARMPGDLDATFEALRTAVGDEDLSPLLVVLEPLFREHGAAVVAAAAVALLRRKAPAAAPGRAPSGQATTRAPAAWVRLFVSVGERDQVGPGDLLGAIIGEAGVEGSQVGKIEMRDTFSLVEVEESVAERVIRALNGTTIRGRSTRVDFDRGGRSRAAPRGRGAPRRK